jgi:hypothetical protein
MLSVWSLHDGFSHHDGLLFKKSRGPWIKDQHVLRSTQGVCHSGAPTSDSVRHGAEEMYSRKTRGDLIERRSQGRGRIRLTEETPDNSDLKLDRLRGEHCTRAGQESLDVNLAVGQELPQG